MPNSREKRLPARLKDRCAQTTGVFLLSLARVVLYTVKLRSTFLDGFSAHCSSVACSQTTSLSPLPKAKYTRASPDAQNGVKSETRLEMGLVIWRSIDCIKCYKWVEYRERGVKTWMRCGGTPECQATSKILTSAGTDPEKLPEEILNYVSRCGATS